MMTDCESFVEGFGCLLGNDIKKVCNDTCSDYNNQDNIEDDDNIKN